MKYPAKNPAKFLKPEPDIEAGYSAGSGFSQISGRFLLLTTIDLATLVDGGGVQVDRWPCCLSTV